MVFNWGASISKVLTCDEAVLSCAFRFRKRQDRKIVNKYLKGIILGMDKKEYFS